MKAAANGQMRVDPLPGEPTNSALPPVIQELKEIAHKINAVITFPERVLLSPLAYLADNYMCNEGSLTVERIRSEWKGSTKEAQAVVHEMQGMALWAQANGSIKPSGRSDLFHGTTLMRAAPIPIAE